MTAKFFMHRAIRLASLGLYDAPPNPYVGAVLVKNDKIISQGYHERFGLAHAEVNAIDSATESVEGAEMYVNLEPCSHHGKTPACADYLIEKKIKKVFIAMLDPHKKVAGAGVEKLRRAGIEVEVGLLEDEAKSLNRAFIKRHTTGVPLVIGKLAMGIDGSIALDSGESKWITNELARQDAHRLRASVGAIIIGKNTAILDDPMLSVRGEIRHRSWDRQPIKVLFDRRLEVSHTHKIFQSGTTLVVHTSDKVLADTERVRYLKEADFEMVLRYIAERFDINSVLVEGGSVIISEFLKNRLIDEMVIYQAPVILGSSRRVVKLELTSLEQRIELAHKQISKFGDNIRFVSNVKYGN